jgi:PAS domain S-box-containing protein
MASPRPNNPKKKINPSRRSNSSRLGSLSSWRLIFLLLSTATLFFLPLNAAAQESPRRVLILTGSNPNQPGFSIITKTVESTLRDGSRSRVQMLYELQEGLVEPPKSPDGDQALASYLRRKYENARLDLILVMVASRFRIVSQQDPELFRDIPKVFYDFDNEREETNRSLGPNITGVWASLDLRKTLDLAFALQPDARKVVVVSGSGQLDQLYRETAQSQFREYESKAEFSYLTSDTIAELGSQLAGLPPKSFVIFLTFRNDKTGNTYSGPEGLSLVAPQSSAPIYGYADTLMGLGITGGNLLDFEATGKQIGGMGLRVLAGEKPEGIPQENAHRVMTVDWRELQRWGISEARLPLGSVVRFKQPSFWELYKWYVIGLVSAVVIEALLIAWLLFISARRRQAEKENLRLAQLAAAEHKRLDEIVSNVPGVVWETAIDPDTRVRKTTFISDYLRKMLGYTPEEWLAQPPGFGLRIMPEARDRDLSEREAEAVVKTGRQGFTQCQWTTKDGRRVWVESYLTPIFNADRTVVGLRGVTLDVNSRKEAEENVRQAQERNRAILRAIPDLIFLQSPDGTYLDCHAQNPEDLIVPPDQLIGRNMRDVLQPELADQFACALAKAAENTEPCVVEYNLTINQADRWFEARLVRSDENILSVVRDITTRKLAEAALQQSELNYRTIFNAANDAIFVYDLELEAVLDVNERMCEMYGWTVAEARQASIADFSSNEPPFTLEEAMRLIQKAAAGQHQMFEWKAKKKSGEFFWVEAALRHILIGGRSCLLSVVRDITERKRATDELRRSEERFGKAFRANPQPMSITAFDGRYLDVNDSFLEMSGYTRDEVIGKTTMELRVWESADARTDFVRQVVNHGSTVNVETRFRTRNGSRRILLSSAELLEIGGEQCLLIASSDITDRVHAEQAVQESEERFRNMADTAPVMIWIAGPDKLCNYFNQQWLDFTGRHLEEELGNGWAEGVHEDDYDRCLETYQSAFDRGEPFRMEYRLRRGDGTFHWVFDTGIPRFSPSRDLLGFIGSCVDINDRKKSEEDLVSALRELVVAHEEVSRLKNQLQEENIYLKEEINLEQHFGEIVGQSDALKYILFKVEQVAPTETTVLITGETGTGKELVARAIHKASSRRDRPLVKVNCGALSASLIESELFGHEKGAFTGASARKIGRFELADGATIFLDEIGELPSELQVKLLRVIQEGELERLGSSNTLKVDVRIIAATNRNLDHDVKKGLFREDLWYRLNVFPITVPPLRQRPEDIPMLIEHFTSLFNKKFGKTITTISPATLKGLREYTWPGNVRELANVIERATINSNGSVLKIGEDFNVAASEHLSLSTKTLEEMERDYIIRILEDRGWRIEGRKGAARLLGLNPSTLRTRMNRLGIQKPQTLATSAS